MPIPDLVCVFVHKSENYLFSFHCRVIREQRLFHLRGHTQNSGLVNLIPESLLPLVPISTFPLTEKWPRRPEIGIKDDCFKEMEQEYMYSIRKKKKDYLFRCSAVLYDLFAVTARPVQSESTKTDQKSCILENIITRRRWFLWVLGS